MMECAKILDDLQMRFLDELQAANLVRNSVRNIELDAYYRGFSEAMRQAITAVNAVQDAHFPEGGE